MRYLWVAAFLAVGACGGEDDGACTADEDCEAGQICDLEAETPTCITDPGDTDT
ncbi:MAG: hypothetical protein R3F59_13125 [Myxococcota bacterium]